MVSSLLTTKFFIPQLTPNLVSRPRLIKKLNQGLTSKLILVSAPPGFGKSTLISEWVTNIDNSVTWLSLDKNDNRLRRFLSYLIAALQQIDEAFGEGFLSALETSENPPVELILSTLINQIAVSDQDIFIVLDDYHQISTQTIHDCIDFLIQNLPPNLHFVICSRVDPPLALSRLRARDQMVEIRPNDLRFTDSEVSAFLNDVIELNLSKEEVSTLLVRTEGWITGLRLAALSLRDRQDKKEFVEAFSGSHHFIIDYLVDEVMSRQPEEIRSFLRRTSILDRFNASLCDAVLESSNSKKILQELNDTNIFLIPLDDQRNWYRYHQLFSDFLAVELNEKESDNVLGLHKRAALWLQEGKFFVEAINHALAGEDHQHAAVMIERLGPEMIMQNEFDQLASWLDLILEQIVESRPWLCIIRGWLNDRYAQFDIGEHYLHSAESALDGDSFPIPSHEENLIRGHVSTLRALYALKRGQITVSIQQSNQALALLPEDYFIRCTAFLTLGWAKRAHGDLSGALQTQVEGHRASLAVNNMFLAQVTKLEIGKVQYYQGYLHKAVETFREAIQLKFEKSELRVPYAGSASIGIATIFLEWNDLDGALRYVQDGIDISISSKLMNSLATGYSVLTSVYLALGNLDLASQSLRQAENLLVDIPDLGLEPSNRIINSRIRLLLAQEKLTDALDEIQRSELDNIDGISFLTEFRELIIARVLIYVGRKNPTDQKLAQAHKILATILDLAKPAGYITTVIEALVLQALAFDAQGKADCASNSLEQALLLAQPEGYLRTFINEGEPLREKLLGFTQNPALSGYVAELLSAFEGAAYSQSAKGPQPLVEPLSERELDVLKLLATELSGPEIAQELMISINTMRTHTKNIYTKLGVNSRRSAVGLAKELQLL